MPPQLSGGQLPLDSIFAKSQLDQLVADAWLQSEWTGCCRCCYCCRCWMRALGITGDCLGCVGTLCEPGQEMLHKPFLCHICVRSCGRIWDMCRNRRRLLCAELFVCACLPRWLLQTTRQPWLNRSCRCL